LVLERKKMLSNFSEWFHQTIDRAEIADYRYPVKGCGVWLGYGMKLRNNTLTLLRRLLDESGHEEMLFPTFVPQDLLAKEATHVKSFEGEAYWITHGGHNLLDVRLALRPTSEAVITPMVKLWTRSHADLPRKIYQIGSIFRYETKATKPLIRVREVSTFKEAHTFHATHQDAEVQTKEAVGIYVRFYDELLLPYLISSRPSWDRFAGAVNTVAFDTIFPDGKILQIGTVHDLGQNFAKAFDATFENKEGERDYLWQTSYGISERVIAALVAVHGDDHGLILPPKMAPVQVVVIPIPYKGSEEVVNGASEKVQKDLTNLGYRAKIDNRSRITPGFKFYEWELKGVPLRIEIGPREAENCEVTLVTRVTRKKAQIKVEDLQIAVEKTLKEVEYEIKENAWSWLQSHVNRAEDLEGAKGHIDGEGGIVEVPWCGDNECGTKIEEKLDVRVLGTPIEDVQPQGQCVICSGEAKEVLRLARAY
jgi:prolyl-tRNA synthetase